jgi:hypothetical protein
MFDEELERILHELPATATDEDRARYRAARELSERSILTGAFDPV